RRPHNPRRGCGISPVVTIVAVIVLLGVAGYLLNTFGILHLWGEKRPAQVTQELPPPVPVEEPAVVDMQAAPPPEIAEVPAAKPPEPAAMRGPYAFQVSSWQSMSKAQEEVDGLSRAGFNSFVEEITMNGVTWYRVRVGYYSTASEAKQAAEEFALNWESGYYVAKIEQ
ncbi:MAG: SPOR domain-containing protein, partial [Bacteroidota bacterium]